MPYKQVLFHFYIMILLKGTLFLKYKDNMCMYKVSFTLCDKDSKWNSKYMLSMKYKNRLFVWPCIFFFFLVHPHWFSSLHSGKKSINNKKVWKKKKKGLGQLRLNPTKWGQIKQKPQCVLSHYMVYSDTQAFLKSSRPKLKAKQYSR